MKKMKCKECTGRNVFDWKEVSFPNKEKLGKNQIEALELLISAGEAGVINLYPGVIGTNTETGAFALFDEDANVICEFPNNENKTKNEMEG